MSLGLLPLARTHRNVIARVAFDDGASASAYRQRPARATPAHTPLDAGSGGHLHGRIVWGRVFDEMGEIGGDLAKSACFRTFGHQTTKENRRNPKNSAKFGRI